MVPYFKHSFTTICQLCIPINDVGKYSLGLYVYAYEYLYTYTSTYVHICIYTYTHVCTSVRTYFTCIHTYIYRRTDRLTLRACIHTYYVRTYVRTYTYVHTDVCVCIYIYVYIETYNVYLELLVYGTRIYGRKHFVGSPCGGDRAFPGLGTEIRRAAERAAAPWAEICCGLDVS